MLSKIHKVRFTDSASPYFCKVPSQLHRLRNLIIRPCDIEICRKALNLLLSCGKIPGKRQCENCTSKINKMSTSMFEVCLKGGAPWGFRLTGGKEFRTSLRISKVSMNLFLWPNWEFTQGILARS